MFPSLKLYQDQEVDLDLLMKELLEFGYQRVPRVTEEGDFSRRGGIVDIFPVTFEFPVRLELDIDRIKGIHSFSVRSGSPVWQHQIIIILPKRKSRMSRLLHFSDETPLHNFVSLKASDLVVHVKYGIGRYMGMKRMETAEGLRDHLVLEYAGGDTLFVPVEDIHLLQKYIGFEGRGPRLSRLGSKEWQRIKERARKGVRRLAMDLLNVQAARSALGGISFSKDTSWQRDFEKTFPYRETPDQLKATQQVKQDMELPRPMDRLLCGDVGYGKTEVALRAAFKAVMDNRQVAFLVPTTILAQQHFENFAARLDAFPIRVEALSRFRSLAEQRQIIDDIQSGKVDIVIGTHRLLSDDISFKDLGLVIIDEEQRFGVKAKEKLKHLRLVVDVLTLTATPIPRTLYMGLMGAKDISVINTPPEDRLPVKTFVGSYNADLMGQAIQQELRRNGQVYFVHNRIFDIDTALVKIKAILPSGARVALAHGQMPASELERVMADFLKGDIDILVSTMIIESGIDVPNANTLIVDEAERFGLADLHQLRGRVGRFNRQAYAYFFIHYLERLNAEARKRLEAIEEFSELGSGFLLAMEDLEIRGAGNLLGTQQHGFIMSVGFDLYCRLLREAVEALKSNSRAH